LGLAIGPLITGPLSDKFGRKRPLIAGIVAFILASLLCIIAPSVPVLTVLRFIQGMAGAAGIVIAVAIARDLYSGNAMARFLCFRGLHPLHLCLPLHLTEHLRPLASDLRSHLRHQRPWHRHPGSDQRQNRWPRLLANPPDLGYCRHRVWRGIPAHCSTQRHWT